MLRFVLFDCVLRPHEFKNDRSVESDKGVEESGSVNVIGSISVVIPFGR